MSSSSRGGHGRTPGATDPRQGKARGETHFRQASSGVVAVIASVLAVALIAGVAALLVIPEARVWGFALLALVGIAIFAHRRRRRWNATPIGRLGDPGDS